ncbi:Panacea domain-containing protein [Achromobacter insolitus]|uniref:Panacea domain-containing protein n=1 Tax=Achromobacter insolitus TaxID=217204 RepID=UPI0027DF74FF|nr:Panacea domain-containing protein [Achromobacter insolitus]MDQ6213305.1 Panacea domain-containing protein [Achromobacter insolitus]
MTKLQAIIRYLCMNYPYKGELSNARVTKMVYLADWLHAQQRGEQLTDISWHFDHYGPFVTDVVEAAKMDRAMSVQYTTNMYGSPKVQLSYMGDPGESIDLTREERKVLDHVIEETAPLAFSSFINHVYDTYPIRTADRYSTLDLADLARQEHRSR